MSSCEVNSGRMIRLSSDRIHTQQAARTIAKLGVNKNRHVRLDLIIEKAQKGDLNYARLFNYSESAYDPEKDSLPLQIYWFMTCINLQTRGTHKRSFSAREVLAEYFKYSDILKSKSQEKQGIEAEYYAYFARKLQQDSTILNFLNLLGIRPESLHQIPLEDKLGA